MNEVLNRSRPSVGTIYRKIRYYRGLGERSKEKRWRKLLSKHEAKNLRRLMRRSEWLKAFDDLLDIRGLWHGMRLSTLHTVMDIKCDEVSLRVWLQQTPTSESKSFGTCVTSKRYGIILPTGTEQRCRRSIEPLSPPWIQWLQGHPDPIENH